MSNLAHDLKEDQLQEQRDLLLTEQDKSGEYQHSILDKRFQQLEEQYKALLKEKESLDRVLQAVISSRSWRMTAPLRALIKIIKTLWPLFRFATHRCELEPANALERNADGSYRITGPTPYFIVQANNLAAKCIPSSWVMLEALDLKISDHNCLIMYLDFGDGFSEQTRRVIQLSSYDRLTGVIRLKEGIKAIRLDPFEQRKDITLHGLKIKELGSIQILALFLGRHINRVVKNPRKLFSSLRKAFLIFRQGGLTALKIKLFANSYTENYQEWVERYDTLSDLDKAQIVKMIESFKRQPLISIVMPVYNTPLRWLEAAIESVRGQLYQNWELCIADDASSDRGIRVVLERYSKLDSRIRVVFRDQNGHISLSSNSALQLATGEYVAFLDHDDELVAHSLAMLVHEINLYPEAKFFYSDEDKLTSFGMRFNPYFKSDFNREFLYAQNYACHFAVYERALVNKLGGFRQGFEGSQDWDLELRVIEQIKPEQIRHIPMILYRWRAIEGSTAQASSFKEYALKAGKRALEEHFERTNERAKVELLHDISQLRVRFQLPEVLPLVSIIIPTRDMCSVLRTAVESIKKGTSYPNYELIIVDNGSINKDTLEYLNQLKVQPNFRVIRDDQPFNFSRLNNLAVKEARGEFVALLNNDLELISKGWLEEMVSIANRVGVGAVGARLWYPNDLLQHAGVILGIGGVAGHAMKGVRRGDPGYFNRVALMGCFSAVTGACLLVRKDHFQAVGGLNEDELAVAFNDIDLCLKLSEIGLRNIVTPYAEFYHHESVSRGYENTPTKFARFEREVDYMKSRWGDKLANDPYFNPNLSLLNEAFLLGYPPRVKKPWKEFS